MMSSSPAPPNLPCPSGWIAEAADPNDRVIACEPWSMDQLPACADGQARFPGDAACAELGPCPSGRFAAGLDPALYVDPSASPGGSGTMTAPYPTIAEALMHAGSGGARIALSKGTHAASATAIDRAIELAGACAS